MLVTMMQTAEPRKRNNFWTNRAPLGIPSCWRVFSQAQVSSILVMVADVFTEQAFQVTFIEWNHMIKKNATATANPTLRDTCVSSKLNPRQRIAGTRSTYLRRVVMLWHR